MRECLDFIVQDLEMAEQYLPETVGASEWGRVTKYVATGLKARILLHVASPLYADRTVNTLSVNQFDGDRMATYRAAKEAAISVIEDGPFALIDCTGGINTERAEKFKAIMTDVQNSEQMFVRNYHTSIGAENRMGLWHGPNGYHNWAGNTPIQNLVDDYQMMDGTEFDWGGPEAEAPFQNRDPRFYATILYDGADWKPRTDDVAARDPFDQIQTGQYEVGSASNPRTHNGLDTRLPGTVEDWNGTHTGYYMRKFIDPDPAIVDQNTRQQVPWPFFRYTEAVLNYVEACIETGDDAEARLWLNKIRFRAGMPEITASGSELMEEYRNERRIELVYEEHRYHDARRWMIAPETLGEQVQIITISGQLKPGKEVPIYRYDPESYDYTYTVSDLSPGIENRQWLDKMYYLPIHRDEMNRNDKLVQNPGYSD